MKGSLRMKQHLQDIAAGLAMSIFFFGGYVFLAEIAERVAP